MVSVFSLLVVLMTSAGFTDGVPLFYYQRLNIAVISVALPIVGMILFTAILLGLPRKSAEAAKLTVIEGAANSAWWVKKEKGEDLWQKQRSDTQFWFSRDIETDRLGKARRHHSRCCSGLATRFNLSRSRRQADLAFASHRR